MYVALSTLYGVEGCRLSLKAMKSSAAWSVRDEPIAGVSRFKGDKLQRRTFGIQAYLVRVRLWLQIRRPEAVYFAQEIDGRGSDTSCGDEVMLTQPQVGRIWCMRDVASAKTTLPETTGLTACNVRTDLHSSFRKILAANQQKVASGRHPGVYLGKMAT